jgi:hypothetical protein
VDCRTITVAEKISLDLTRNLPLRCRAGKVLVIDDRPAVLLPVIRKRLMKVAREIERQRSSVLGKEKRMSLQSELDHLQTLTFAVNTAYVAPPADVVFSAPEHPYPQTYATLYLLASPDPAELSSLLEFLQPGGVIVSYVGWTAA